MAPEAKSLIANKPSEALEMFRSAGTVARELLDSEFSKDVGSLYSRALEPVFQALFDSNNLAGYLNGTRSQRIDAFLFAQDVLALGVDHVAGETVEDLFARILGGNQARSSDQRVFVPALGALVALSHGDPSLRSMVLAELEGFVSAPGTRHNASTAAIVGMLLDMLDERANAAEKERVVAALSAIRRNAPAADSVVQLMDSQIRERLGQFSDPTVAASLPRS